MDDQGKRVLRSFPNHPGESWNRFEGRDRRQIFNVADSIQKHLIIKIFHAHREAIAPEIQERIIDVCILKVCDDLIAKSPERPMDAFTRDYLQLIASIADALYELGYDRRGSNWNQSRLWDRMQHEWSIAELLRGHERRAQKKREKLNTYDVREFKHIAGLPVSGYYLAAIDTPGAYVGEGMIADNCAADYIDKPASRIYAVRREWLDPNLTIHERTSFLRDLCIFTDKNGKRVRKTTGLATLLRATAQIHGDTLTLEDSVRAAKKFTVAKIDTLLTSVNALLSHGEAIPLDIDMPVASLEVQRKGESSYMLIQALGPRNVPIRPEHPEHQVVAHGLAALKREYRTKDHAQLSMGIAHIFASDTDNVGVGIFRTATSHIQEQDLIAHLRAHPEEEVLLGTFSVQPDVAMKDLLFLQSRGVQFNLEHATGAQKTALKTR